MRRFAAVMNHRSAGFKANAMGVWAVPEEAARRDRPADGRLRRREPLLQPPDVRRLALQRVHDGARPHRTRLRSDDRRDPDRDRRRRVLPALVGEGVQEGARALLHSRVGRVARRATSKTRSDPGQRRPPSNSARDRGCDPRQAARRGCRRGEEDRLLVGELGDQPASFMRSFATTHGYARYGTTEGGASPRPLLQSTCNHRSAAWSGSAGRVRRGTSALGVLGRQPTVGRDVVDARRARARLRRATHARRRRRARPAPVRRDCGARPAAGPSRRPRTRSSIPRRRRARPATASRPDRPWPRPTPRARVRTRRRGWRGGNRDSGGAPHPRSTAPGCSPMRRTRPRSSSRTTRRTPARPAASSTRRVPSQFTRVIRPSSGIGPTIAARCTTVSTSWRYGVRSAFTMSARWNVSFRARRAGSRTSSPTMRSTSGEASNSGSNRWPMKPEMPVTATVPRTTGDRLAQWPTFPKWDRDFRSRVASTSRS